MPKGKKQETESREPRDVQEIKIGAHTLDCGGKDIYTNASAKDERLQVTATNNCEFTAYLWINFNKSHFICKDLKTGETFNDTVLISPGGSVELWCSLVSTVKNCGCSFSVTKV